MRRGQRLGGGEADQQRGDQPRARGSPRRARSRRGRSPAWPQRVVDGRRRSARGAGARRSPGRRRRSDRGSPARRSRWPGSRPSAVITAAHVSSQLVSIARITRRLGARDGVAGAPHDHRVLAGVAVVARPGAGRAEAEALVERDRAGVRGAHLERVLAASRRPRSIIASSSARGDPLAAGGWDRRRCSSGARPCRSATDQVADHARARDVDRGQADRRSAWRARARTSPATTAWGTPAARSRSPAADPSSRAARIVKVSGVIARRPAAVSSASGARRYSGRTASPAMPRPARAKRAWVTALNTVQRARARSATVIPPASSIAAVLLARRPPPPASGRARRDAPTSAAGAIAAAGERPAAAAGRRSPARDGGGQRPRDPSGGEHLAPAGVEHGEHGIERRRRPRRRPGPATPASRPRPAAARARGSSASAVAIPIRSPVNVPGPDADRDRLAPRPTPHRPPSSSAISASSRVVCAGAEPAVGIVAGRAARHRPDRPARPRRSPGWRCRRRAGSSGSTRPRRSGRRAQTVISRASPPRARSAPARRAGRRRRARPAAPSGGHSTNAIVSRPR